MALFTSRQGEILWQELPEFLRTFDATTTIQPAGAPGPIEMPGDLQAFLLGFGHVLDRFDATLSQFYADGFMAPDPVKEMQEIQPWLVPYFADLFGVTLFGPDPKSRRSELSQAIWVARRRGTRLAVDRAAESILQRAVIAVPGIERVLFSPSLKTPLLTQSEITGEDHVKDALILHEDMPASSAYSDMARRHHGLPLGTRHVGLRMRAVRSDGFLLDSDSKPALDTLTNSRIPTRFRVTDKAGLPCFRHSYEDRALRTPDIRSPGRGRKSHEILARPDIVVLHVDPPPGVFDDGLEKVVGLPVVLGGKLVAPAGISEGKTAMFEAGGAGDLRLDQATGLGTPPVHDIAHLYFDGTLVVGANTQMQLENFAVRRIVLEAGASLSLKNGICEEINTQNATEPAVLEYVTVMGEAHFRTALASDCIFGSLKFSPAGKPGCIRFSRVIAGTLPARIALTSSSRGPVEFLRWPCLPDTVDDTQKVTRQAQFGEPGYGVLSPDNLPSLREAAEDGSEPGAYHGRFHLARLSAAERRAESFTPAGYHVFARYDLRSAAPLPSVDTTI